MQFAPQSYLPVADVPPGPLIGLAWRALVRKQSDRPGSLIILGDAESRDGAKRRLPRREQRELFVDLHATLTVHKSIDNASAPIEGRTVSNWTRASTRSSTPRLVLQKAYATWSAADAHARVRTVRDTANTPAAQTNHSLVGGRLRRVQPNSTRDAVLGLLRSL